MSRSLDRSRDSTRRSAQSYGLVVLGVALLATVSVMFDGWRSGLVPGPGHGPENIAITGAYAYLTIGLFTTFYHRRARGHAVAVSLLATSALLGGTFLIDAVFLMISGESVGGGLWRLAWMKVISGLLLSPIPMAYSIGVWYREGDATIPTAIALALYAVPLAYFFVVAQQFGGFLVMLGLVFLLALSIACLPVFACGLGVGLREMLRVVYDEALVLARDRAQRLGLR